MRSRIPVPSQGKAWSGFAGESDAPTASTARGKGPCRPTGCSLLTEWHRLLLEDASSAHHQAAPTHPARAPLAFARVARLLARSAALAQPRIDAQPSSAVNDQKQEAADDCQVLECGR